MNKSIFRCLIDETVRSLKVSLLCQSQISTTGESRSDGKLDINGVWLGCSEGDLETDGVWLGWWLIGPKETLKACCELRVPKVRSSDHQHQMKKTLMQQVRVIRDIIHSYRTPSPNPIYRALKLDGIVWDSGGFTEERTRIYYVRTTCVQCRIKVMSL